MKDGFKTSLTPLTALRKQRLREWLRVAKKAAAVEAAADRKASVIQGHRDAWPDIKALNRRAIAENDFDLAKLAKISAETERLIQDGERKAWGIADKVEGELPGVAAAVQSVSAEIAGMLAKVKAAQE